MSHSVYVGKIRDVIRKVHGAGSKHLQSVPVKETFQDQTVWEGTVEVFELIDHPTAKTCYAWAYTDDKGVERTTAVLEIPPVTSPITAVRASIVAKIQADSRN